MARAAKLVAPRALRVTPELDTVPFPPAAQGITRAERNALLLAIMLHLAVLALFLMPDRRLGTGGIDLEAIGIDIVTVAPALEARSDARGRGAAAADRQVAEQDGTDASAPEQVATLDAREAEAAATSRQAPPPAELVVREWVEPPRLKDDPTAEPVIAPAAAHGATPQVPTADPAAASEQASPSQASRSAAEVLAQFRGGAAARGHEPTETLAAVMAAARSGQRDTYKEAILNAIRANPPRNSTGLTGIVKLEYLVQPDGTIADIRIARSSRNTALDELAANALRALRLPPPPGNLTREQRHFDQEFTFR